ncbi:MAG: hypothetical protein Q7R90_01520 [bacterium]|nr:hypothetical protein [bacterium]
MDTTMISATVVMEQGLADLIVDVATIVIGLASVYIVTRLNRNLGGKIKSALQFFVWGVVINIIAVVYTTFLSHAVTIGGIELDAHNLLMAFAMIFFILSTYRFSLLVARS